ncbi:uncharacterized protein LOC119181896 isoform X2 [Rhipicephalus microplus]|uniref:uncharacterized protein LOC119181896 isoform X2 n=1 Tax=Rhipicephalus microplus TaxID=6941 RepID=UPI003F6CB81C
MYPQRQRHFSTSDSNNRFAMMTRAAVFLWLLGASLAASPSSSSSQSSSTNPSSPSSSSTSVVSSSSSTSTKRDDFSAAASSSHPVYSPSVGSPSSVYGASSPYGTSASGYSGSGSGGYGSVGGSAGAYEAAASSNTYHSQASPNSNLYYYYYPVSKNSGQQTSSASDAEYQASAAQNYAGVSAPGSGSSGSSSSSGAAQYAHLSQLAQQYGPQLAAAQQYAQYAQPGTGHYGGGGSYPSPSFQGSYDTSKRYYGLGSVIMPLLALAGLGLLIPTVTSLSGKKKRSIEDASRAHLGDYAERLERYFKIYRAAVESEECMNRIVCELGDAVSNVRGKSALLTVMEKFAPGWMNNKIGVFKNAALTVDTTKCSRYKC